MTTTSYSYRLFSRSDYSTFWALFTDNLVNLMVLSGVCQFVFQMPPAIVYGRIVPGAAIAILAGIAVYAWLAKRTAEKAGHDVTALPYGISTPVMFVTSSASSARSTGPLTTRCWLGRWASVPASWAGSWRLSVPFSARFSSG